MFWSKTKDVVQDFSRKKDCFQTVEETLLGSVLNSLTWCGKKGSNGKNSGGQELVLFCFFTLVNA